MKKNLLDIPCPYCGQPLTIADAIINKTKLRRNTKRTLIYCSHCKISVKEAVRKRLNFLAKKLDGNNNHNGQ